MDAQAANLEFKILDFRFKIGGSATGAASQVRSNLKSSI
jgi:hypothetical protein